LKAKGPSRRLQRFNLKPQRPELRHLPAKRRKAVRKKSILT
jgi:hypothetical protein